MKEITDHRTPLDRAWLQFEAEENSAPFPFTASSLRARLQAAFLAGAKAQANLIDPQTIKEVAELCYETADTMIRALRIARPEGKGGNEAFTFPAGCETSNIGLCPRCGGTKPPERGVHAASPPANECVCSPKQKI